MAKYSLQSLIWADGNEYEFFGKTYFGTCSTSASNYAKTVSISGFNSNSLVEGVRVVIRFTYGQSYTSAITLNVSNTGAKSVYSTANSPATKGEWAAGEIVSFIYSGTGWFIENGGKATGSSYGRTMLTNVIDEDSEGSAVTPKGVYDYSPFTIYAEKYVENGNTIISGSILDKVLTAINQGKVIVFVFTYEENSVCYTECGTYVGVGTYDNDIAYFFSTFLDGGIVHRFCIKYSNGEWFDLGNITYATASSVPTVVSDLTNDAGYLTLADLPIYSGGVS